VGISLFQGRYVEQMLAGPATRLRGGGRARRR